MVSDAAERRGAPIRGFLRQIRVASELRSTARHVRTLSHCEMLV